MNQNPDGVNLFCSEAYKKAHDRYTESVNNPGAPVWDYVFITAANEGQAVAFSEEIEWGLADGLLPKWTKFIVLPDPEGVRAGSGGALINVLNELKGLVKHKRGCPFRSLKTLVIHAGGESRRVPQYSVCGKIFAPVFRLLPNGKPAAFFDELMALYSGIPALIKEGLLSVAGDVFFFMKQEQFGFDEVDALSFSVKAPVKSGENHGVFIEDNTGKVKYFLHKRPPAELKSSGAVDENGLVNIDTGAVLFSAEIQEVLHRLTSLKNTSKSIDPLLNLNLYDDILSAIACAEKTDISSKNQATPQNVKDTIRQTLKGFSLSVLKIPHSPFIHYGTTRELLVLNRPGSKIFSASGFSNRLLLQSDAAGEYSALCSIISGSPLIGKGCYIENSFVGANTIIGDNCIISESYLEGENIPENTVVHTLRLSDGHFCVRTYGTDDDFKGTLEDSSSFFQTNLKDFVNQNALDAAEIWPGTDRSLWEARLFPVCENQKNCHILNRILYEMVSFKASQNDIKTWRKAKKTSLKESFYGADFKSTLKNREYMLSLLLNQ